MLVLPSVTTVTLVSARDASLSLERILVDLEFSWRGGYYFAASMLTDKTGRARLEDSEIRRKLSRNQELFPMDYRVDLEDCDSIVEIVVQGGIDFVSARAAALPSTFLLPEVRERWATARNEEVVTARLKADFSVRVESLEFAFAIDKA
jgi:hypothetical protein